jgi:hypothetical protein
MVECSAVNLAGRSMRFSIRDLIWLTVVVALVVGWMIDRRQLIDRYDNYIRENVNFKWMEGPP